MLNGASAIGMVPYHTVLALVKYGVGSPKFIWAPCAQLYSLAETPQSPPHLVAIGQWSAKIDDISM